MARVAVVTGASRGIGRGVALELAGQGWQVYATGRAVGTADLPRSVLRRVCDHSDEDAVARMFAEVVREAGRVDVLVNGVWGGYERMVEDGRFTWGDPF
jgi:NAD(P)-dependent dehydrogenase (short-subunit alcohol dehydrogenase family)